MTISIAPVARQQFLDSNGNPLVGGKMFTYLAGTNTKTPTYTDSTGASTNTNPIILDSSGRTPYGVWLTQGLTYKYLVTNSFDSDPPTSPIYTEDNISPTTSSVVSTLSQWDQTSLVATYVSTTSFSIPTDVTVTYHPGRRLRILGSSGYTYSTIVSSTFASSITTIVVRLDSGVLDSTINKAEPSVLTFNNQAIPNVYITSCIGRNLLINPLFNVNQRLVTGTVTLLAGKYGHDRWKAGTAGCTYTFASLNGLTTITITAGSLTQIVEDINVPVGSNVLTLSWVGTAQGRIGVNSYSASPQSATVVGGTSISVEFNTGTISYPQLEKSTFPTSFEQRSVSVELDLCRRYYEAVRGGAVNSYLATGVVVANTIANIMFQYYPKRRLPVYADFSVVSINGLTTAGSASAGLWSFGGAGFTSAMLQVNSAGFPNNVGAVAIVANSVANTGGYMVDVEL